MTDRRDRIQIRLDRIERIHRHIREEMVLLTAVVTDLRREYNQLVDTPPRTPRYRGTTAPGEPRRVRGRPRKDGLVPGSPEAREADMEKEVERRVKRELRLRETSWPSRAEKGTDGEG